VPQTTLSRIELLLAAVLFSTGGAAVKATTLSGWQVASFRSAVAAVAIFLLLPASRRGWTWRVPVAGVAYATTMILYVLANKLTTAANTIFLQDTAPLYLLLLGPFLIKERIRKSQLVLMAVFAVGISLFFIGEQPASVTAPRPLAGNLVALVSGVSWALTIAGLRWLETRGGGKESGMAMVAAGNVMACLLALPAALPVTGAGTKDWLVIGYLGLFQVGLAYVFLTRAMRRIPALEASLLLLLEPALNPIWAWLVQGERPGTLALAGGGIILAGTVARLLSKDAGEANRGR